LHRHLSPRRGEGRRLAQALVSTSDDERAHVTADGLASSIKGLPVVCLLLNVDFKDHFDRLYCREIVRFSKPNANVLFELSMRFDCRRFIEAFQKHGCLYRVITRRH
jgi:hypothetical protein